jgi:hypothetical protein
MMPDNVIFSTAGTPLSGITMYTMATQSHWHTKKTEVDDG